MFRSVRILLVALLPCLLASSARAVDIPAEHKPDIKTVRWHEKAYRYTQAGWVVLHIEGDPYPRGYQQGKLLAVEIAKYVEMLAQERYPKDAAEGWKILRTLTDAMFLRKFDKEFLDEMKGIADGAAEAGAEFEGRKLDLIDIATVNVWQEIDSLEQALAATPTGTEKSPIARLRCPRRRITAPRSRPRVPPPLTARSSSATSPCSGFTLAPT